MLFRHLPSVFPSPKLRNLCLDLPFPMRERLVAMFPIHKTYVDPFAGALAVLLGKPRVKCEVVNDLNEELVMFFRYVRLHGDALLAEIDAVLAARREFEFFRSREPDTELGKALAFFFRQMLSFGGIGESFSRRKDKAPHWGSNVIKQRILAVRERLRRVYIECKPANEVIAFYDTPDTFFFLDPPYIECSDTAYDAFTEDDMNRLRDTLVSSKGKWLLTCDDSPVTRRVFSGFRVRENLIRYSLAKTKSGKISGVLMVFSENLATDFLGKTSRLFPLSRTSKIATAQTA